MDSPAVIPFVLTAIAGVAALELRRGKASVIALGAALGFFAVGMLMMGAVEVGVGVFVAGAVLMLAFNWAYGRAGENDSLPALPSGSGSVLAVVALIAVAVAAYLVAPVLIGITHAGDGQLHAGLQVGLLREVFVVLAAAAAVWAMLRKTGRREE